MKYLDEWKLYIELAGSLAMQTTITKSLLSLTVVQNSTYKWFQSWYEAGSSWSSQRYLGLHSYDNWNHWGQAKVATWRKW